MQVFLRTSFVWLASLAFCCGIATGQEQERKLIDRIQNPDRTITSPLQGKSFGGTAASPVKGFSAASRSFGGADKAPVKEYSGIRSFFGIKNPWFGAKVYSSESASIGNKDAPLANRVFPVGNAAVRTSPLDSKKMASGESTVRTVEFAGKGGAQGALDQITDKVHKEMTIDDIRELLNNPR